MLILNERVKINQPQILAEIIRSILKSEDDHDQSKEHFWAIGVNTANVIEYIDLVSLGILDAGLVHPREVFRFAVMKGVKSIFIAHNHPSGSLEPSKNDINITEQLQKSGEILGIPIVDHVIIGDGYFSFRENNLI